MKKLEGKFQSSSARNSQLRLPSSFSFIHLIHSFIQVFFSIFSVCDTTALILSFILIHGIVSSMTNSSDSSFSFHNKRHHQFKFPISPLKKPRRNTVKEAVLHIKTIGLPLISRSTGQFCESLCLEPYTPYTIGRKLKSCHFIFTDRRVSKRHCQLYFDSLKNKIYLSDGLLLGYSGCDHSFSSSRTRVSTNGAFVNGISVNGVVELRVGDVVSLVCVDEEACGLGASIGFLVEKAVFVEKVDSRSLIQLNTCTEHPNQTNLTLKCCRLVDNMIVLASWCRDIMCSEDPIFYIKKCISLDRKKRSLYSENGLKRCCGLLLDDDYEFCSNAKLQVGCHKRKRVYSREVEVVEHCGGKSLKEIRVVSDEKTECSNIYSANADTARQICSDVVDFPDAAVDNDKSIGFSLAKQDFSQCRELVDNRSCGVCAPPGKKFYLNRLQFGGEGIDKINNTVSLPELFHPIEGLKQVFIATFTSDILW